MKISSTSTIESIRQLRFAVEALTAANSAICSAQTQMRLTGHTPAIDMAAEVQRELKIAGRRFRDAFNEESKKLDDDAAEYLHTAVWK